MALALIALVGVRSAILLSFIPGALAAIAIIAAVRAAPKLTERERRPLRIRVRPVLRGQLGRLLGGITAFELGNAAATLLILRATELLEPRHGHGAAVKIALGLYAGYNLAAAVIAIPGGRLSDRRGSVLVLCLAAAAFVGSFAGLALVGASIPMIALLFALGGIGIGLGETAQSAAVAAHSAPDLARLRVRSPVRRAGVREPRSERDRRRPLDGDLSDRGVPVLATWSATALAACLAALAGERRGTLAA